MLALLVGACEGPQLTVSLKRVGGLPAGQPEFVKFQIRAVNEPQATEFGPFDVDAIPDEQFAEVRPGEPFYIDVIGCKSADPVECQDEEQFVARGCSGILTLERGVPLAVEIELDLASVNNEACPP